MYSGRSGSENLAGHFKHGAILSGTDFATRSSGIANFLKSGNTKGSAAVQTTLNLTAPGTNHTLISKIPFIGAPSPVATMKTILNTGSTRGNQSTCARLHNLTLAGNVP